MSKGGKRAQRRRSAKRRTKAWQEFERLASDLESCAGSTSVTVKCPDRIRSLSTNRLREVDASIRVRVGSTEVLITIECRDRTRLEDITWIEQLVTKRAALGISRTIAVSAKGFTEGARQCAAHHGIELRHLAEISRDDILNWCQVPGIEAIEDHRHIRAVAFGIDLADGCESPVRLGEHSLAPDIANAKTLIDAVSGQTLSAADLITIFARNRPAEYDSIVRATRDGTFHTLSLELPRSRFQLCIDDQRVDLCKCVIEFTVTQRSSLYPITRVVRYSGESGTIAERAECDLVIGGQAIRFALQRNSDGLTGLHVVRIDAND